MDSEHSYRKTVTTVLMAAIMITSVLAAGTTGVGADSSDSRLSVLAVASSDSTISEAGANEMTSLSRNQDNETVAGSSSTEYTIDRSTVDGTDGSITQSVVSDTSTTSTAVRVVVGHDFDWSYASNDTVNIWVGALNMSAPIPLPKQGTELWVNITRPDGTIDSMLITTNTDGNANITYALAGKPDGQYQVHVSGPNVSDSDSAHFQAGPIVPRIFPGISDVIETGRLTTIAVLVSEDSAPVDGDTRNVSIKFPNGTDTTLQETTDTDGFATFNFTPPEDGQYRISTENTRSSYRAADVVGNSYTNNGVFRDTITTTNVAHINGVLYDDGTPYANEQIYIEIVNTTDYSTETVVANISTTTDSFGQFLVSWSPNSGQTGRFDLRAFASESNTTIALEDPGSEIKVQSPESSESLDVTTSGTELNLELTLGEGWPRVVKPGGDINLTVQLTEDGLPVSGATVQVGSYYGFDQVPQGLDSVTTDSSGEATLSIVLPTSAPDGAELTVSAFAVHNGSVAVAERDAEIQQYIINDRRTDADGVVNYTIIATDPETDDPVSGVPITVSGETYGFHSTVFGTDTAETGADGSASINFTRPNFVKGEYHLGTQAPYKQTNTFPRLDVEDYSVTVNGIDQFEYRTGETVTFNYTTDTSANVSARIIIDTYADIDNKVLFAGLVKENESVSFSIPSSVPDETSYSIELRTISENGQSATGSEYFKVNNTGTTDSQPSLSIQQTHGITTSDRLNTSKQVAFIANRSLTYDNGTNYYIRLTDTDTDASVTLAFNNTVTVPAGDQMGLITHEGNGSADPNPYLWPVHQSGQIPAEVISGSIPAGPGLFNFSVTLLNATTGAELANTAPAPAVLGYSGRLAQNSTSGTIKLSVPQDVVPDSATATLVLRRRSTTGDIVFREDYPMTLHSSAGTFVAELNAGNLTPGNYSWKVKFESDGKRMLQIGPFSNPRKNVTITGTTSVTFNQHSSDGTSLIVDSVFLKDGGFVAVHNGSPSAPIIGNSQYLTAGNHDDILIPLEDPLPVGTFTLSAVAYNDTNTNRSFDFPSADSPYISEGVPVSDATTYTVVEPVVDLTPSPTTISVNSTKKLTLTLSSAPNGLSGYWINVSIENASVTSITNISIPAKFTLNRSEILEGNETATFVASDLNEEIGPGKTDVMLGTVTVTGKAIGHSMISIDIVKMDDDTGAALPASVRNGSVTIQALPLVCSDCGLPTDPDGDGKFEDLNGNGDLDFNDIVVFFDHLLDPAVTDHIDAYDFNANGRIDFADLITLFNEI